MYLTPSERPREHKFLKTVKLLKFKVIRFKINVILVKYCLLFYLCDVSTTKTK